MILIEPKDTSDQCSSKSDDLESNKQTSSDCETDTSSTSSTSNTNEVDLNLNPNNNNNNNNLHNDSNIAILNTNDMNSFESLNKCHLVLFPKKSPVCDDEQCMQKVVDRVPILSGEYICFIGPSGKLNEDILVLTNYRLLLLSLDSANEFKSFVNVPIMLIELIEIREIFFIYAYLKNAKTIRLTFSTTEKTALWSQRLNSLVTRMYKLEELFSFTFYSWLTNESKLDDMSNESMSKKCLFSKNDQTCNLMYKEFKRMKFDSKQWRLSDVNKKFALCRTYPETLIVPKSITDEQLNKVACFRSSKRFPAVVWRSKKNGAVLARSSQPNVGLLAWRLNEDELLLKAIADSCSSSPENSKDPTKSSMLLIIDARFRSVALANRVKGGGYEYSDYYTNCEIQFMNLENIHVIRSSFQSLRLLCQTVNDNKLFLSQLENTKWLHHLSGIIKAAITVTSAIDQVGKPVLIHCSDGWDRTPQILGLAKLLLDPFYRTISGFRTLIEIEWLQFGHKFAQRNGHCTNSNDINERCPVFLQWLDCVYQILRQYPSAFQFNEIFLLKLCYHSYSCLFGTFLCDSIIERVNEHTDERTFSIWSYLNDKNTEIINQLYDDTFDEILYPLSEIINMQLWHRLFCEAETAYLIKIDRSETLNFNDSLDATGNCAVVYGSSPLSNDLESFSDSNVNLAKLTPDSSVSSINNLLLKNAIIDHTNTTNTSNANHSTSTTNSSFTSNYSNHKKARSFDDLRKLSSQVKLNSSEPNLLLLDDALATPVSCSKLNEQEKENLESSHQEIDKEKNDQDKFKQIALDELEKENKTTHSTNGLLIQMQNSTDTLVDETQMLLKNLATCKEDQIKIDVKINNVTLSSSTSEIEESSSTTSTSSSTIPSPLSMKNVLLSNSVSTSTSGLYEYINSQANQKPQQHQQKQQRFNLLNNTIKNYFNSNYDFIFNQNDFDFTDFSSISNINNNNHNHKSNTSLKYLSNIDNNQADSTNGSLNGNSSYKTNNNRKSSNSIPIVNNNSNSSRKNFENLLKKRNNKKTIKDMIDIDGLTKIEDRTYRKIIERDEKNRKEIIILKEQVNKFKWFFNKLASNSVLQDISIDFPANEFSENSQLDENQSANCYSFGNESVCSSWDEIDESDYKLATWVPDYYVTHCQSCNQKFTYRFRKHHCRNCGQVFCYKCADYFSPIPNYNLHAPVRVCYTCKIVLEKQLKSQSVSSSTPPICTQNGSSKTNTFINSSRCNQSLDSNKLNKKLEGTKSQKVSV